MRKITLPMTDKLVNQLAQLILYIEAIDSLSKEYPLNESHRGDSFLFGTVYDGLWDAAIVRIATLWDNTKSVASLPKLAIELKRLNSPESKCIAKQIENYKSSEWDRLKVWRHNIVAHAKFPLDPIAFDEKYTVRVHDLRTEAEQIELLLADAMKCLGETPVYFKALKDDAKNNAKSFLSKLPAKVAPK